jgi:hypothetical protein
MNRILRANAGKQHFSSPLTNLRPIVEQSTT